MTELVRRGTRDPRAIRATAALADTAIGPVSWIGETGSTNVDLMDAARLGAPHGTVLVADHQTAGRGRRERRWDAEPGHALMVSVVLEPVAGVASLALLANAVGLAAAEACTASGADGISLKWPNDLVVGAPGGHRKLAGVLAQSLVSADRVVAVVGLGLNVRGEGLPRVAPSAIALDELVSEPDREQLLVDILRRLDGLVDTDPPDLRARYLALSATVGTFVDVTTDDGTISGRAVDVTEAGLLVVQSGTRRHEVVVGDVVSVRPGNEE